MKPDPEITHDLGPVEANADTQSFEPDLEAAMAAAFGPDSAPGGWSQPPLLRDDPADDFTLVQPSSSEMPRLAGERYQLLGEIARGGMGVILKGRDPNLGRDLAFKVLKAELAGRQLSEQRFVEEAQVSGQLQHPGIVPVYQLGRFADGRPYFTMKLLRGRTLAAMLTDRTTPQTDRGRFLKVFEQVTQTVAYAHSKGVIHRDLKPSNIMVGNYGEVQVMDWGLAKVIRDGGTADEERENQASLNAPFSTTDDEPVGIQTARSGSGPGSDTVAGSILGTPSYMPPEQASGEIDKLDERADVFGLGAVLCVILTGHPPYLGDDAEAVRLKAIRGKLDHAFARLDKCGADAELVSLCKQCLAPEREKRPRHAGEVAATMAVYLQSIEDRAQRAEVERAQAEVREAEQRKRRRVQTAFAMSLTVAVGLIGFGFWWQERHASAIAADRVARQSRTTASVTAAIDDARARMEEAWRLADEPEKMQVATNLAQSAVRRAEGFATAGESTPELDGEIAAIRTSVNDLNRHTRLFVAADLALRAHDIGPFGQPDGARTSQRLAEAFRQFGWDPVKAPVVTLAEEIVASRARNKILGFLCDWEFQASQDKDQVQRIIKNVRLRSGEQLARWQFVMDTRDWAALVEFSANPNVLAMGPELICALGRDLVAARPMRLEARLNLLRRAVERYPTHVWINFDLMHACKTDRRNIEAIHYASAALAARPDSTLILVNLGQYLLDGGAYDHAARIFQKALTLAPNYVDAFRGLATAFDYIGDRSAALQARRALVRVSPKYIQARIDLGLALSGMDDLKGAIAEFKEATRLQPSLHLAHYRLGQVYEKLGAYEEAAAAYRSAVKYSPTADGYKRALSNIGRLQHLVSRLLAVKQGAEYPATTAHMAALAGVCCTQWQKEYALAVRLYADAFNADPALAATTFGHRYNAACAALRLAAGDDANGPIEADEAFFHRNRAWEWLAADLARYRPFANSAQSESRRWASDCVAHWMTDPDLDSVRDPKRRESLPENERLLWDRFWAEVETMSKPVKTLPSGSFGKLPGP